MTNRSPIISILLAVSATPLLLAQTPATLNIELKQSKASVSPMLYGLMTEEINFSYDGGLYAEMVRNRTFRAGRRDIPYWLLVEDGNAQAKMGADRDSGPSEALTNSLKLEVTQADDKNQA